MLLFVILAVVAATAAVIGAVMLALRVRRAVREFRSSTAAELRRVGEASHELSDEMAVTDRELTAIEQRRGHRRSDQVTGR